MDEWSESYSPFHRGEQEMHKRLGIAERQDFMGRRVMRRFMPDQHRDFFAQLPFVILGSVDHTGAPWASILAGPPGFIETPSNTSMCIKTKALSGDPISENMLSDAPVSLLGIEPETRRRNRANLRINTFKEGCIDLRVTMSFGNCPQYIQAREADWSGFDEDQIQKTEITHLSDRAKDLIARSDTFFVASHNNVDDPESIGGVDVNHRGGKPGFIKIDGNTLIIPDFRGNNAFNTLGNFIVNPRAGLLFLDFETGDVLQITGSAKVLHDADESVTGFAGAQRSWSFTFEQGHFLHNAVPNHWRFGDYAKQLSRTGNWT